MRASTGKLFGMLTAAQKEEVLNAVAEEAAKRFEIYYESVNDGIDFKKPKGADLLQTFQTRSPEIWAYLQNQFPDDYEEQMRQWGHLLRGRLRVSSPEAAIPTRPSVVRAEAISMPYEGSSYQQQ